jgi:hypothetical protein
VGGFVVDDRAEECHLGLTWHGLWLVAGVKGQQCACIGLLGASWYGTDPKPTTYDNAPTHSRLTTTIHPPNIRPLHRTPTQRQRVLLFDRQPVPGHVFAVAPRRGGLGAPGAHLQLPHRLQVRAFLLFLFCLVLLCCACVLSLFGGRFVWVDEYIA